MVAARGQQRLYEMAKGMAKGRAEAIAEKARQAKEMVLPDDVIARLFGNN